MPTLTLPATLTHAELPACLQALAAAWSGSEQGQKAGMAPRTGDAGEGLLADASALQQFDSSALALLLEARRTAADRGQGLTVRGLPPRLAGLAALYGVADFLAV